MLQGGAEPDGKDALVFKVLLERPPRARREDAGDEQEDGYWHTRRENERERERERERFRFAAYCGVEITTTYIFFYKRTKIKDK